MKQADILGVSIQAVTAPELLNGIRQGLEKGERQSVATVTNEMLVRADKEEDFRNTLNSATWRVADTAGIVWASHFKRSLEQRPSQGAGRYLRAFGHLVQLAVSPKRIRTELPGTIPGSDLSVDLAAMCEEFGYGLFLLGAGPGVAAAAGDELKKRFPRLRIAGVAGGGKGSPAEDEETRRVIQDAKAQVILVAFGAPKQEQWIARNLASLSPPVVAVGVGGTLDYLAAGTSVEGGRPAKAPPVWVRQRGFEWLWRLVTQPNRWRRIVTAGPVFVRRVIRDSK